VNILLTGASGQLGQELQAILAGLGQVVSVDRFPAGDNSIEMDLSDLRQLESHLDTQQPNVVINAAAYTAVDKAESEHHTAFRINAELPAALARWCSRHDAFLLHYSTDYVFSGESDRPYLEGDLVGPLGVYGESKLAGEWAVGAADCRHLILRTSWVYSTHGSNFVLNMLRLARQRSELSIVSDQTGCPTWARNLAAASATILQMNTGSGIDLARQGIFHYCDSTVLTWYDFASLIFELAVELNLLHEIPRLKSVRSTEFPQVARRPAYSALDTSSIRKVFGITPAGLETSLRTCLKELEA
jgi:dTDP-4-dehydrorhamnose reductase